MELYGNEIAIFSYQGGEKMYNFITISGYLAGKREWVHFGPNPWDWDRNEICGQIFSGSRTEHTCSVRLVDFEVEGIEEK